MSNKAQGYNTLSGTYSSTMAVCQVSSCCQGENWTATAITAAAELASEPVIPDLETWGSGSEPSVLASSVPATMTNDSVS